MEISRFESPQNHINSNSKIKKLLFATEVGLFELAFVGLLLFIVFGTLVYFNVIHLQNIAMPHNPFSNSSQSPSHVSPTNFPGSSLTDNATLYIQQHLLQTYYPTNHNYLPFPIKNPTIYTLQWDVASFSGRMRAKISSQTIEKYLLEGVVDKPQGLTNLTPEDADKLFKKYFAPPANLPTWRCDFLSDTPANTSMCFTAFKKGNDFIGYEILSPNNEPQIFLYSCQSTNFLEASLATGCRRLN